MAAVARLRSVPPSLIAVVPLMMSAPSSADAPAWQSAADSWKRARALVNHLAAAGSGTGGSVSAAVTAEASRVQADAAAAMSPDAALLSAAAELSRATIS